MSNIDKIRQEIERRMKTILGVEGLVTGVADNMRYQGYKSLLSFIDSLPEDASCVYDTNKLTPTPSVNIEDVARVQFASHAHVFGRKRKAVFDWKQFKEVAGIFYGFGKRDSLPEEKPSDDLEEAAVAYSQEPEEDWRIVLNADKGMAFIAGAEWQAKRFEGSRLAACKNMTQGEYERETEFVDNFIKEHHRLPTISDAIELTREQMMKEAVEGRISSKGLFVESVILDTDNFKLGDKVKIIVIKDERTD